jgi:chromosome segregation ATPase
VTATFSPRLPIAAWGPLQDAAAQFRDECAAWEQATHDLFSDLDRLRQELATKAHELDDGRRRLAERGRQLADQRKEANRLAQLLEQQEAQLAEALTELRGLRQQHNEEYEEARRRESEQTAALQAQIATLHDNVSRLQTERDELKDLVNLAQNSDGTGASPAQLIEPLLKHFADLKQSMDATRGELSGAIDRFAGRLSEHPSRGAPGAPLSAEDQSQVQEMQKERVELEGELELVRARAAELQELVQQLKRELTEQRSGMTDELREMRRLLGHHAESPAHRETYHVPPADAAESSQPEGRLAMTMTLPVRELGRESARESSRENPRETGRSNVRDSTSAAATADPASQAVMAQFAKLQRDVALRRKKK